MSQNNYRYDLSDRLIHFFRGVRLDDESAPLFPENLGYASIHEDAKLTPQFLLRHAIRMGRLYATWSIRNGRRTVYGNRPAICFTEMPIPAFIEAGRLRQAQGQAMSPYGIVFPKATGFAVGARPVIYGLSGSAYSTGGQGTPRLLDRTVLPLDEQYRYVAYDATKGKLDWSHEREWRWPLKGKPYDDSDGSPPSESTDLPGLDLDNPALEGLGVIVSAQREADEIAYDILTKVDRGDVSQSHYEFVLAHATITNWDDLRERGLLDEAIQDNLVDLSAFFTQTKKQAEAQHENFRKAAEAAFTNAPSAVTGEPGGCWLWLLDNHHLMTRALVKLGVAKVSKAGKYLVDMSPYADGHNLRQREEITKKLAADLSSLGLRADYFAVLNSNDPDEVPFYNGDQIDDRLFYNWN